MVMSWDSLCETKRPFLRWPLVDFLKLVSRPKVESTGQVGNKQLFLLVVDLSSCVPWSWRWLLTEQKIA